MAVPTVMDGGALGCPGAVHGGLPHTAGFIKENEGAPFSLGFFCVSATVDRARPPWPLYCAHESV